VTGTWWAENSHEIDDATLEELVARQVVSCHIFGGTQYRILKRRSRNQTLGRVEVGEFVSRLHEERTEEGEERFRLTQANFDESYVRVSYTAAGAREYELRRATERTSMVQARNLLNRGGSLPPDVERKVRTYFKRRRTRPRGKR
jgi:hypothetical protein